MEEKRTLYFTSPGFKSQEILIAPDLDDSKSKRKPLIDNEDHLLNLQINELDEGTKLRNRQYQERLDQIWKSTANFDAILRTEAKEAVETILNLKDDYQIHIDKFNQSLQNEIKTIFDKLDNELLPNESNRIDIIETNHNIFINEIVPLSIEKQSGEVSRQLRRAYETFDIEKKKEFKREMKLVNNANQHIQNTAQRFNDENALLSSCFYNLEDDVYEYERHAVRLHLIRNDSSITSISKLNEILQIETKIRTVEDVDVLDTLIETQELLQKTVLLHFGTQTDDSDDISIDNQSNNSKTQQYPVMNKLNKRMEKISNNQLKTKENDIKNIKK